MKRLNSVTLLGIDCVDIDRLVQAADICQRDFEFGEVKLLTSLENNHANTVRINPINSKEAYSKFIIEKLNDYVKTDFVLVIQYDGFILNPAAWTDEFLNYDYIGAPWLLKEHDFNVPDDYKDPFMVGNGGFSIRSKKLLKLLQKDSSIQITDDEPEDTFICSSSRRYLESKGIKFAPTELAKEFSLESNEEDGVSWTNQFGFHGLKWTDISSWLHNNPEYEIDNTLDKWSLEILEKSKSVGEIQHHGQY